MNQEQRAEEYAEIHAVNTKDLFGNIVQDFLAGWNARQVEVDEAREKAIEDCALAFGASRQMAAICRKLKGTK